MTFPATQAEPADAIVMPLPSFRLEAGEPLGAGLKRLSVMTIEHAVSGFYDGEESFGLAVHESRKAMKQIRALLRLVRFEIGERAYRYENTEIRDTARMLSDVRTTATRVQSVDVLRGLYGSVLAPGTFDELLDRLAVLHRQLETRVMEDPVLIPEVVRRLDKAHSRYSSWPIDTGSRHIYGIGIRDSFEAIGPGLRRTFHTGRRQMVGAYRTQGPQAFHAWRKPVKYLRHQMDILTPLWPEVVLGMAITLDRIGALLGQDHDLADLLEAVSQRPDLCPNPVERSLLTALAEQRRSDLQMASRILGRRIYAESAGSFHTRFGAFWDSARHARDLALTSIPY